MTGFLNIYNAAGTVNVLAISRAISCLNPGAIFRDSSIRSHRCGCVTRGLRHRATATQRWVRRSRSWFTVASAGRIPADGTAEAAVVNLTGVAGSASTLLSVFPTSSTGTCTPTQTSTINLLPGAVEANRVMVELGPSTPGGPADALCVFNAVGTINVIVDANGWFGSATVTASPVGYQFQPVVPTRICDTRVLSTSCTSGGIGPAAKRLITVAGHAGVPAFAPPPWWRSSPT